jgi:hypothetical protein
MYDVVSAPEAERLQAVNTAQELPPSSSKDDLNAIQSSVPETTGVILPVSVPREGIEAGDSDEQSPVEKHCRSHPIMLCVRRHLADEHIIYNNGQDENVKIDTIELTRLCVQSCFALFGTDTGLTTPRTAFTSIWSIEHRFGMNLPFRK